MEEHDQDGPYENQEDLIWLAACALTRDFTTLFNGVIQPKMLGEDAAYVAQRLLESQDRRKYLPTVSDLRKTYPHIDWPDDDDIPADSDQASDIILMLYQSRLAAEAGMRLSVAAYEHAPGDEAMQNEIDSFLETVFEIRDLGSAQKSTVRLGEDIEALESMLFGSTTATGFRSNIDLLDEYMVTWEPGLHVVMARPKHGKSRLAARAAAYNGFERDSTGIVVDGENSEKIVMARIVCNVFERHEEDLLNVITKGELAEEYRQTGKPIPPHLRYSISDLEELSWFQGAMEDIRFGSRIRVFGKKTLKEMGDNFTVEFLLQHAEEVKAEFIVYDQIHTGRSKFTKKNESDSNRIKRVADVLSNWPEGVVFGTTQKNREAAGKHRFDWDSSHDKFSFGSDGISHKCSSFFGLQTFKLEDEFVEPYHDRLGIQRYCNHIQCITPIQRRERAGATEADRIFVYYDACSYIRTMSNEAGTEIVQRDIDLKLKKLGENPNKGSKKASKTRAAANAGATKRSRRRRSIEPVVMDDDFSI